MPSMKPMKSVDFEQIRMKILGDLGNLQAQKSDTNDTNSLLLKYFLYKEFYEDAKMKDKAYDEN